MKLAIIKTAYNPTDTQSYNVQEIGLAKGLLNYGVSTDFYSIFNDVTEKKTIAVYNDCEINLIPITGKTFFGKITYFPGLTRQIIKNNYDIVQVHEDSQLMTPLILKKCHKQGIKTVLYQGMYVNYSGVNYIYQYFLDLFFKKSIIKNADIIFAKTGLAKKYLENKRYKNISILPVGLDYEKEQQPCRLDSQIMEFKAQYDKTLLYVGKIEARRNPFFLIDVLSHLTANIVLIVVGDGPLYIQIMDYAKQKKISDRVLIINSIPNNEIYEVYTACDVLLLPTNYEIYGMVVMEALLNGIPVIATPEAGPLSILTDETLGVCLPLEIEKWTNKILYYFSHDTLDARLCRTETVKKIFNWHTIAEKYYTTITSI
jgi:glycosyltransferase involved in cell wall biosynthesis